MEKVEFSLVEAKKIYNEGMMKDNLDCKIYISKYFYPTVKGDHFVWDGKKFNQYTTSELKEVYFNRLPKNIGKWYFVESDKLYKITSNISKPRLYDDFINLSPGFMYTKKKYQDFEPHHKAVSMFLDYIFEAICDGDDGQYEYLIKWLANMARGNKNQTLLYLRSESEGVGKSTLADFISEYVLGEAICCKGDVSVLKTDYNSRLCGKLLVYFEELPQFGNREWEGISSKLKDMITGSSFTYSDKYEKSFEAPNLNNYILNTNCEAIKHSEGRRYFILDLNTKYLQDFEFFGNLRKSCFNKEVGEAFFNYLLEVDIDGWSAREMPMTKKKKTAIVNNLCMEYNFIKDEYILQKRHMKITVQGLYDEYVEYCRIKDKKPLSKYKLNEKLKEIQIMHEKINVANYYRYSYEQLKEIADKFKWIHDLDEFANEKGNTNMQVINDDIKDETQILKKDNEDLKEKNEDLKKQNEDLKKQNEDLKKQLFLKLLDELKPVPVEESKRKIVVPVKKPVPVEESKRKIVVPVKEPVPVEESKNRVVVTIIKPEESKRKIVVPVIKPVPVEKDKIVVTINRAVPVKNPIEEEEEEEEEEDDFTETTWSLLND